MKLLDSMDQFLFPPPQSLFLGSMSLIILVSLAIFSLSEIRGKHLQYSKFWNVKSSTTKALGTGIKLSSRTGMLILYTPAFLAGLFSLGFFDNGGIRFLLVDAALTLHFFKRIIEVLFVHKYSSGMVLDSAIIISLSYFISTATMIYNQHMTQGLPEPELDLKYAGVVLFLVGISANFYHHILLAKLREKNEQGYKMPKGGMFNLVICPHYLFEILAFVGISFISQTIFPFCFTIGTCWYLMGRSDATRTWYLSKFPKFPKEIKRIFPYMF